VSTIVPRVITTNNLNAIHKSTNFASHCLPDFFQLKNVPKGLAKVAMII
jgi:hypothetical protein